MKLHETQIPPGDEGVRAAQPPALTYVESAGWAHAGTKAPQISAALFFGRANLMGETYSHF